MKNLGLESVVVVAQRKILLPLAMLESILSRHLFFRVTALKFCPILLVSVVPASDSFTKLKRASQFLMR